MPPRRRKFANAYLRNNFNITQAAITAGYSEKTAPAIGSYLLKDVKVKEYISNAINKAIDSERDSLKKLILVELRKEALDEIRDAEGNLKHNPNKMKALEMLAKYCAVLTDRVELTGKDGGPVTIYYDPLPASAKE